MESCPTRKVTCSWALEDMDVIGIRVFPALFAVGLTFAAITGCQPGHELETAPAFGMVTLDGQPLRSGYVIVCPERGRMATGAIDEDGSFVLSTYDKGDGAQVGTHSVIVKPPAIDEVGADHQAAKNLPRKYSVAKTSGLSVTVRPGERNELNLDLETTTQ